MRWKDPKSLRVKMPSIYEVINYYPSVPSFTWKNLLTITSLDSIRNTRELLSASVALTDRMNVPTDEFVLTNPETGR